MFGTKLHEIRTTKGWSLRRLAAEADLCPTRISDWESNRRVPSWDAMLNLCLALDVDCAAFAGFDTICSQGRDSN